jgi:hypothetical protein
MFKNVSLSLSLLSVRGSAFGHFYSVCFFFHVGDRLVFLPDHFCMGFLRWLFIEAKLFEFVV